MKTLRKLTSMHIHEYEPNALNSIAYSTSRFQMDRFCNIAPSADHQPISYPQTQELLMLICANLI